MQSFLHGVASALTPTLTTSKFKEKGWLTPEEFVAAGDLLVYKVRRAVTLPPIEAAPIDVKSLMP